MIQPSLSLVDREVEFCVPATQSFSTFVGHGMRKKSSSCDCAEIQTPNVRGFRGYHLNHRGDRLSVICTCTNVLLRKYKRFWFTACLYHYIITYIKTFLIYTQKTAAEIGRNPVSKHQIQPEYGDEQADAGRDCRTCLARPNSQAQRGQENIIFSCSADHEQDWQPYPVDPYSCYMW